MKTDMCVNIACLGLRVKKFKHYRSSFGSFGTIKKFFARLCYRSWNAVICVSPHIMREAESNIVSCKPVLLNDAVYFPRMDNYEKLCKPDLGVPESAVLCFAIGYDYRLKGIDLACEAVKSSETRGSTFILPSALPQIHRLLQSKSERSSANFPNG